MARNILDIWGSDRDMLRSRARSEALRFSWDHSMERLFGHVYPAAFGRRAANIVAVPAAAAVAA